MKPDMRVSLAGLELTNPVIAASGTFGYGIEFEEIVSLDGIGGFVTKGISMEPMAGHAAPRIIQTAAGMLNAIGLQNVGVEEFIARKLPPLKRYPKAKVIVNVFGYTVGEYIAVIERLNHAAGIAAYELNVSCPNVHAGGMAFGSDPGSLEYLVSRARAASTRPLIVKLSPNVTSIATWPTSPLSAGANAVSVSNTFLAMSIDPETRKPRLTNVTGGLSGPAIKPIALRMVYETAKAVTIPSSAWAASSPRRRCRVPARRSHRCSSRHRQLRRPPCRRAHRARTRILVPGHASSAWPASPARWSCRSTEPLQVDKIAAWHSRLKIARGASKSFSSTSMAY